MAVEASVTFCDQQNIFNPNCPHRIDGSLPSPVIDTLPQPIQNAIHHHTVYDIQGVPNTGKPVSLSQKDGTLFITKQNPDGRLSQIFCKSYGASLPEFFIVTPAHYIVMSKWGANIWNQESLNAKPAYTSGYPVSQPMWFGSGDTTHLTWIYNDDNNSTISLVRINSQLQLVHEQELKADTRVSTNGVHYPPHPFLFQYPIETIGGVKILCITATDLHIWNPFEESTDAQPRVLPLQPALSDKLMQKTNIRLGGMNVMSQGGVSFLNLTLSLNTSSTAQITVPVAALV